MDQLWKKISDYCKKQPFLCRLLVAKDGCVIIAEWPNGPLWLVIILWIITRFPLRSLSQGVGYAEELVLGYWAILEIGGGVNLFRRILGVVVLILELTALFHQILL